MILIFNKIIAIIIIRQNTYFSLCFGEIFREIYMEIIGREKEKRLLKDCYESKAPEFLVVYGRRRIGKTYLIREYYKNSIDFYVTGLASEKREEQLKVWNIALNNNFGGFENASESWIDAFELLRIQLEKSRKLGKKVVFIDEAPWLDTPKSGFMLALEHFWNGWASGRTDILLIVCGSATSWIINNLLKNKGGLHNRVTRRMNLLPFSLGETEQYLKDREFNYGQYQICETYMIFGGVPYYLSLLTKGLSLAQNVDLLCFNDNGFLRSEFDEVYSTLFKNSEKYVDIITALSSKSKGMSRDVIISTAGLSSGGGVTQMLEELEACGFIRIYRDFSTDNNLCLYQLIDPFSIFYLHFMKGKRVRNERFWSSNLENQSLTTWKGYAFERICLLHSEQIKQALGIAAISTEISSWSSRKSTPGAQIDLLFDRRDGIINLCEIKFYRAQYAITSRDETNLRNKIAVFEAETQTRKAVNLTMITTYGIVNNSHSNIVHSEVTLNDFFK